MKVIKIPIVTLVLLLVFIASVNAQVKDQVAIIKETTYKEASQFIFKLKEENLVSEFDFQISGIFEADKIKNWIKNGKTSGIMFWYGVKEGGKDPFISFERKGKKFKFSNSDMVNYLPNRPWKHPVGIRTIQDVEKFDRDALDNEKEIEDSMRTKNQKPVKGFKRADSFKVRKMRDDFKSNVSGKNTTTLGFTFFSLLQDTVHTINNKQGKYWDLFFEQGDVKFIRYYLGFNEKKEVNPICMILVPVDKDGKNFSKKNLKDDVGFLNGEPMLLEFSWPPKPSGLH